MEKVEADLSRSKSLREKQTKEFGHQLEELQQKYEQQVSIRTVGGTVTIFKFQNRSHVLPPWTVLQPEILNLVCELHCDVC